MKYKTYIELKEELGDKYDKYMYDINLDLMKKIDKAATILHKYKKNIDETGTYVETYTGWKLISEIFDELEEILGGDKEC